MLFYYLIYIWAFLQSEYFHTSFILPNKKRVDFKYSITYFFLAPKELYLNIIECRSIQNVVIVFSCINQLEIIWNKCFICTCILYSGLDPAYPGYSLTDSSGHLAKGDAIFVDVIHTNPGIFGFPNPIGDVDFYPNPGMWVQPGCWIDELLENREFRFICKYSM